MTCSARRSITLARRLWAGTCSVEVPGHGGKDPWNGWWGDFPPFHTPVFVLTHHPREPLVMQGGTPFTFITDGFESALNQAREAAGGRDVALGGGASVAQQYFAAGLIDEMEIHLVPLLLGGGERLFDNLGGSDSQGGNTGSTPVCATTNCGHFVAILHRLDPREHIIFKPRWGAFYGTALDEHLRSLDVNTLAIAGCNFPNCPRASIYEASERDFRIVVVRDAVSGLYQRGERELANIGVLLMNAKELMSRTSASATTHSSGQEPRK